MRRWCGSHIRLSCSLDIQQSGIPDCTAASQRPVSREATTTNAATGPSLRVSPYFLIKYVLLVLSSFFAFTPDQCEPFPVRFPPWALWAPTFGLQARTRKFGFCLSYFVHNSAHQVCARRACNSESQLANLPARTSRPNKARGFQPSKLQPPARGTGVAPQTSRSSPINLAWSPIWRPDCTVGLAWTPPAGAHACSFLEWHDLSESFCPSQTQFT